MPHLALNTHKLYYEIDGTGHPLILIAGYTCDIGIWERVREELARHFQLILFDNRGVGRSGTSEKSFTIEDMGEDVLALSQALKLKQPHVLGHSMGGAIVQSIAHRHPKQVNKIIIAQSLIKIEPATKATLEAQLHLAQNGVSKALIAETVIPWLFGDALLDNPLFRETFIQLQVQNPYPPLTQNLAKQYAALIHFDSHKWYPQITHATLILAGDQDRLCSLKKAQEMAANIKGSKLHVFHGVGHVSPVERPEEFCSVVCDFLKSS